MIVAARRRLPRIPGLVRALLGLAALMASTLAADEPPDFVEIAERAWVTTHLQLYDSTLVTSRMTVSAHLDLLDRARKVNSSEELQDLLNELLASFGLSHSGVFTRSDVEYYVLSTVGAARVTEPRAFHIGALYARAPRGWRVRAVLEGYPAAVAGLRRGDIVLSADGAPFEPLRSFDSGRPAQLHIRRGGRTLWVVVAPVHESPHESLHQATVRSVRHVDVDGHRVGVVHLWACTSPAILRDFEAAVLDSLAGVDGIVLDLRDGFGGWWFEYADLFFADRRDYPSVGSVGRRAETEPKPADAVAKHRSFAGRLVAIVNDGTRSGKEGFAYHLQSRQRATLVGSTTAGAFNGMSASFIDPRRDFLIEIPVSRVMLDGHEIEDVGVAPDVRVEQPLDSSVTGDPQLEAAIGVMRGLLNER
jgi:carboxyl-terminal processing protease